MNWKTLLNDELESLYSVTDGLVAKVDDESLDWKPATGENWMTTGQLLMHLVWGNGPGFKGFVTGDWGLPEGVSFEDMDPDDMLPAADAMPAVESVAQAREKLAADKVLAFEVLEGLTEEDLATREIAAPWNPGETFALGRHLLHSIRHSLQHKGQLFYYLKLQGKKVDTSDLWGV
jgi:uncharacterized damage-inducible protein DinB